MGKNKNKEKSLEDSLNFLINVHDNASHAIISTDINGIITSFNKSAEQLLGYQASELIGLHSPAIFHDLDEVKKRSIEFSKKFKKNIEPGFKTFVCHCDAGLKNEFEWIYISKSGKKIPVSLSITLIKNSQDETVGYLGLAQEISDKKLLENELKKRNQDLENTQQIAKIGSWSFEVSTGSITWSKQMFKIFPEREENGEPDFERHKSTIHPDDKNLWEKTVKKCLENAKPYKMLFRTHRLENEREEVWVEARGRGELKNGEVTLLQGTCQDVTEMVRREQQLEKRAKELEVAEKLAKRAEVIKSQFLANMSHEIRTPMNGIIGMLNILNESNLDYEQKKMVDVIMSSSENLLSLLSDILDLSKIEADRVRLESKSFNLRDVINHIKNLLAAKASENNTALEISVPYSDHDWYTGDENRIKQILINFTTNAIKFTKNGKITIGYECKPNAKDMTKIKMFVYDNGIGIAKKHQAKLFDSFVQADSSITRRFGGTGLGLAISSRLANLMGGKIYFQSQENMGSKFFFELALKKGKKQAPSVAVSKINPNLSQLYPHRILIAEDNKVNQLVIKTALKKLGYECDIAGDGLQTLKEIESKPAGYYSIVLMDMQMPKLDGVSTTKKIIEAYSLDAPVIIALTANAFSTDKDKCLNAGMSDYLSKPLNILKLSEMLIKYSPNDKSKSA